MLTRNFPGIAALALVAFLPGTALTQEPTEQVADTAQAAQPTAIAAADIVVSAGEASEKLRETRTRIAANRNIVALAEALPEAAAGTAELLADSGSLAPESLSSRKLTSLHLQWDRYARQLNEWQAALAERAQELGAEQDTLTALRVAWQATSDTAAAKEYPEAAIQVIGSALALIDSVAAETNARFDTVLSLQNSVAELKGDATDALTRIQAAQAQAQLGLFTPESPPLWRAIASPGELTRAQLTVSLRQDLDELSLFWEDGADRIPLQAALSALLLVAIIMLRRRSRQWVESDPELEASAQIFDRPFSVVLLIALLTMRLFHPQIPVVVVDLARLAALIPALRLLPGIVHPALRRPLYGFAILWLLNELLKLMPDGSTVQRLAGLLVTSLALAGLVWSLNYAKLQVVEGRGRTVRFAAWVARFGIITLSGSLIANILGFVGLSRLLMDSTMLSVLLAVALFAAARVLEGLVRLLVRTESVRSIAAVRRSSNVIVRRSAELTRLLAIALWFIWTLSAFGVLRPVFDVFSAILLTPLTVGKMSVSLGNIVAFFLAIYVAVLASRLTRFVLEQDVYPRLTLPRGVPGAITKVSQYLIIGLGLMFAFAASGFDLSSLALLAGALGVGIGFGLQAIVNNLVSGLILIFERPIQDGDSIQLDKLSGTVKHIGIRASTVRTFDGAEVIVPNADLITGQVINWTLSDRLRRIEIQVGVAYGSDPRRAGEILLEVAKAQPDCLENPEPYVLFDRFGDNALQFVVRFWTSDYSNWLDIESNATYAVHDALKEAGIEIPVPQRDVRIKSDESEGAAGSPP